jgi:hypothetical protein
MLTRPSLRYLSDRPHMARCYKQICPVDESVRVIGPGLEETRTTHRGRGMSHRHDMYCAPRVERQVAVAVTERTNRVIEPINPVRAMHRAQGTSSRTRALKGMMDCNLRWRQQVGCRRFLIALVAEHDLDLLGEPVQSAIF